jgi:hypothetical protein
LVAFERSKLALAPLIRSRRKYGLPRLDIPPRRCLPPVEFCRGTSGREYRHNAAGRGDHGHLATQEIGHETGHLVVLTVCPTIFNCNIPALA